MTAGTLRIDGPPTNREQLARARELTGDPEGIAATLLSAIIETVPALKHLPDPTAPALRLVNDGIAAAASSAKNYAGQSEEWFGRI